MVRRPRPADDAQRGSPQQQLDELPAPAPVAPAAPMPAAPMPAAPAAPPPANSERTQAQAPKAPKAPKAKWIPGLASVLEGNTDEVVQAATAWFRREGFNSVTHLALGDDDDAEAFFTATGLTGMLECDLTWRNKKKGANHAKIADHPPSTR